MASDSQFAAPLRRLLPISTMPKDPAAASPLDDAQQSYRIRLKGMSDGQLQRERLRLKVKAQDSWEMVAWRLECSRRVVPAYG